MKKLSVALTAAAVVLVPAVAFAQHVSQCCGDWWCCLQHLGCCP